MKKIVIILLLFCSLAMKYNQSVICGGGYCENKKLFINNNISENECEIQECTDPLIVNCYYPHNKERQFCKLWCDVEGCEASCGYCEVKK